MMDNLEIYNIESAVEGILFASGDPVSVERLAATLGVSPVVVTDTAARLRAYYERNRRGIRLVTVGDALQLCSAPELADTVRVTLETGKQPRMTQPALEVLATVAYFQPVTKAYIEQVRGVDCAYTLGILQTRGLIEHRGHLAVPGRPVLYGTTPDFLRTFGLESLEDLPPLQELAGSDAARAEAEAEDSAKAEASDVPPEMEAAREIEEPLAAAAGEGDL
jgi:segregation and condensation protein B